MVVTHSVRAVKFQLASRAMLAGPLSLLCLAAPVAAAPSAAVAKHACPNAPKRAQPAAAEWPKKAPARVVLVLKGTGGGGSGFWRQLAADLMP